LAKPRQDVPRKPVCNPKGCHFLETAPAGHTVDFEDLKRVRRVTDEINAGEYGANCRRCAHR
jgi:hypothetical protein